MNQYLTLLISSALFFASVWVMALSPDSGEQPDEILSERVFELRTYTTHEGKLEALHQRFENHTLELFERHGMTNIGYWVPTDPELKENTLVFIIAHESAEAAEANWNAFRADPDWQRAYEESHADGPLVQHAESVFMTGMPYSPMQ